MVFAPGLPVIASIPGMCIDTPAIAAAELSTFDTAVTGCTVAVAETGTTALVSESICGRRALSLLLTSTSVWSEPTRSWPTFLRWLLPSLMLREPGCR